MLMFLLPVICYGQYYNDSTQKQFKTWHVLSVEGAIYTSSMLVLNEAWYKDYPRSGFHWFNDNRQWLQMDKAGHSYAAYQVSLQNARLLKMSGMPVQRAMWVSAGMATIAMSSIELFDGYSAQWGASAGDILANATGTALFLGQELVWNEQILRLKYSYRPSSYASKRPQLLGERFPMQMLKDYNAQTYWLSLNLRKITGFDYLPPWLAFAFGYGAGGMLSGERNEDEFASIERYRQFYFSPDIDWQAVPVRRKGVRVLFRALNMIKIPLPAIAWEKNGLQWHWIP